MARNLITLSVFVAFLLSLGCGPKYEPDDPRHWEHQLKELREQVTAITAAKKRTNVEQKRVEAFSQLQQMGKKAVPVLVKLLDSPDGPRAATTLGRIADPESVDELVAAIDWLVPRAETTTAIRKNRTNAKIADALGAIGTPETVDPLIRLLRRSPDEQVQLAALHALGEIKPKEAIPILERLVKRRGTNTFLTKNAIMVLGDLGETSTINTLLPMLFEERRGVSFFIEASYALFQIALNTDRETVVNELLWCLDGKHAVVEKKKLDLNLIDAAVTSKCATVLGDVAEPVEWSRAATDRRIERLLLGVVKTKLEKERPTIMPFQLFARASAAESLARLRVYRSVDFLVDEVVRDLDASYRHSISQALVELGQRKALRYLRRAATKGEFDKRLEAIHAVSRLGTANDIPFLRRLIPPEKRARDKEQAKLDALVEKWGAEDEKCGKDVTCLMKRYDDVAVSYVTVSDIKDTIKGIEIALARLDAVKQCGSDVQCWIDNLEEMDGETKRPWYVRERAAYALAHLGKAEAVDPLLENLTTTDAELRYAIYYALDHLDADHGADKVKAILDAEQDKAQYVKINEYLKRLHLRIAKREEAKAASE